MDTEAQTLERLVFRNTSGKVEIDLLTDRDTLWLSQTQIADFFEQDTPTIARLLQEVLTEREAVKTPETSHTSGQRVNPTDGHTLYDLDVVLAVGYRLDATRGAQFRQWASRILRQYLEQGYVINQQRILDQEAVNTILKRALRSNMAPEIKEDFLGLLDRYEHGLTLLDQYDHGSLDGERYAEDLPELYKLTYEDARKQVDLWKRSRYGPDRAPLEGSPAYKLDLFGVEKDGSFHASIEGIYATFAGEEVYPSLIQKAANLLYFLVKNHGFSDGNKRIAAGLFLYYLDQNNALYRPDGSKRLADNALVALTLFIAMSPPDQQDAVVDMTINLIDGRN